MRLVRWMVPELGLIGVILIPALFLGWLILNILIIVTWPIWGTVQFLWRRHTRQQTAEYRRQHEARAAAQQAAREAAERVLQEENNALRAAGYYVPDLTDDEVRDICRNVVYWRGEALAEAPAGVSPDSARAILVSLDQAFGALSSRVLGTDPRQVLAIRGSDSHVALDTLGHVARMLRIVSDDSGSQAIGLKPGISERMAILASGALGVFARIADSKPELPFSTPRLSDCYNVARNFAPNPECVAARAARAEVPAGHRISSEFRVGGSFDPPLDWLARVFR
jgi:hypothetical protein